MKRVLLVGLLMVADLWAAPFGEAKVTRAEGSVIRGKAGVQTGPNSKAELDWLDGTVARVGANAKFSYVTGTRETTLDSGTLLMSSPKDAGGITVRAGGTVTTAAGGGGDFEVANFGGNVKVISLNGKPTVSLAINPEARKGLKPGQMLDVPKGALKLPKADVVDLKVLVGSSSLLKMGALGSQAAIEKNAKKQGVMMPISLPGGASNEIAAARTTQFVEAQQVAARQQQQIAADQLAAQQLAKQQLAEQQRAATAASNVEQQAATAAASSTGPASTNSAQPSSQGNQGQKPAAPPGQQNKPQNVPPGQAKKQ